jgi:hypothetical protein
MTNKNGKQKSKNQLSKNESLPQVDDKNVVESVPEVKNVEEASQPINLEPDSKEQKDSLSGVQLAGGKKTKKVVDSGAAKKSVPSQKVNEDSKMKADEVVADVVTKSKNKVIKTNVKQVAASGEKETPVVKSKGKGKGKGKGKKDETVTATDTKPEKAKAKSKPKSKKKQSVDENENENENDNDNEDSSERKIRSFKVKLPNKEDFEGRFTGLTPYQAANKALSKYFRETQDPLTEITFSICESTRKSKKTTYTYVGKRQKLDVPVSYTIQDGRQITKNFKNFLKKIKKNDVVE